uniref:Ribosomal L1 domain-containing protein 1 n=1 Tax=Auxenochlorella protothecoides TaxID=3075 RepID=A0A1D2A9P3_AUXPR
MSGAGVPGLNREQVEKAAKALLTYAQKKGQESSNLLLDDELIYLNIALKKVPQTPRKDKPVRLNIPHPIYSLEGAEVCLFVKDSKGEGHKASKKKVKEEQIAGVTKVVGLSKLRTKYESHEAKRKLCNSYDLFLADERVLGSLPKLIGKSFFKKKKQPVPVKLVGKDWSGHISKAVKATYFFWTGGPSLSIRVSRSSHTQDEVVENVIAALKDALPHIPKQWNGVKALYMKTADSVALPIYQASPVPDVVRIKA